MQDPYLRQLQDETLLLPCILGRAVSLIVEGYADAYRVLWEDYTPLKKDAVVWDAGWRAGFGFRL